MGHLPGHVCILESQRFLATLELFEDHESVQKLVLVDAVQEQTGSEVQQVSEEVALLVCYSLQKQTLKMADAGDLVVDHRFEMVFCKMG